LLKISIIFPITSVIFSFLRCPVLIEYDFHVGSEDPIWTDIALPIQPAGFKVFFIE
jgi:hypothetical protein